MPGRWASVAIIGFWLAMVGWFVGREVWTRYGQRPRLQDALREASADGEVYWLIKHNHIRVGSAITEVLHNPDAGTYQLLQTVRLDRYPAPDLLVPILGKTIALDVISRAEVRADGVLGRLRVRIEAGLGRLEFEGEPRGAVLQARISGQLGGVPIQPSETAVPYDARDLFLSSMCPASRMPGLRLGARWETPLVDPTETIAEGLFPQKALPRRAVVAEVMSELAPWRSSLCYDVRSQGPDTSIRILVRPGDNQVLRQEIRWGPAGKETLIEIGRQQRRPEAIRPDQNRTDAQEKHE